jgi:hypothetical protein
MLVKSGLELHSLNTLSISPLQQPYTYFSNRLQILRMSHRETLSLAHTAQCKLMLAADKPDRNLRFLLGHALTLDSINMRLVQIEQESNVIHQPNHSKGVKFKAAGGSGVGRSPLSGQRKTPPPVSSHDDDDDQAYSSASDEELGLQRFVSAAALPPRQPSPGLLASKDNETSSSEDDEELDSYMAMIEQHLTKESLEKLTKNQSDETLAALYGAVKKCPCHQSDAPEFTNFWEVPVDQSMNKGFEHIRIAIAEVGA